jgi:hypothetical protein
MLNVQGSEVVIYKLDETTQTTKVLKTFVVCGLLALCSAQPNNSGQ